MPSLCKKCFFCICPRHQRTSELYKRLGGTGSSVETFHSSVALFPVQEASAQRSWRLSAAAIASPGFTVSHRQAPGDSTVALVARGAGADLSVSVLLGIRVWLPEKRASSPWLVFTHSRKHFQDPRMAKQTVLEEGLGSSLQPEGL